MTNPESGEPRPVGLLPCPFCGGLASLAIGGTLTDGVTVLTRAYCDVCGATKTIWEMSEKEAIAAWNSRPSPAPSKAWPKLEALIEDYIYGARQLNPEDHVGMKYPLVDEARAEASSKEPVVDGASKVAVDVRGAAEEIDNRWEELMRDNHHASIEKIEAILHRHLHPLDQSPGVAKEPIKISGQCNHGVPIGQECGKCKEPVSKCCGAPILISGDGVMIPVYGECSKCGTLHNAPPQVSTSPDLEAIADETTDKIIAANPRIEMTYACMKPIILDALKKVRGLK